MLGALLVGRAVRFWAMVWAHGSSLICGWWREKRPGGKTNDDINQCNCLFLKDNNRCAATAVATKSKIVLISTYCGGFSGGLLLRMKLVLLLLRTRLFFFSSSLHTCGLVSQPEVHVPLFLLIFFCCYQKVLKLYGYGLGVCLESGFTGPLVTCIPSASSVEERREKRRKKWLKELLVRIQS